MFFFFSQRSYDPLISHSYLFHCLKQIMKKVIYLIPKTTGDERGNPTQSCIFRNVLYRPKRRGQIEKMTVASCVLLPCWDFCCLLRTVWDTFKSPMGCSWAVQDLKIPTPPLQLFSFLKHFVCENFHSNADPLTGSLN